MEIIADNIGKKFNKTWIFRNLNFSIPSKQSLAITGHNGSGKSTLLQILSGSLPYTEGKLRYQLDSKIVSEDKHYEHIAYAAPYLELIEELSITELIDFHKKFKPLRNNISTEEFIAKIFLEQSSTKEVRYLSSGMKQRLKIGLALFSDTPVLLLDEPTTNLDTKGIDWYRTEIEKQLSTRTIIICSNIRNEYDFCDEVINILNPTS